MVLQANMRSSAIGELNPLTGSAFLRCNECSFGHSDDTGPVLAQNLYFRDSVEQDKARITEFCAHKSQSVCCEEEGYATDGVKRCFFPRWVNPQTETVLVRNSQFYSGSAVHDNSTTTIMGCEASSTGKRACPTSLPSCTAKSNSGNEWGVTCAAVDTSCPRGQFYDE